MLNRISNYINDNRFKMTVFSDSIYLVNYKRIISIEDNYISFYTDNSKIVISGNNLVLKKILKEELLISGNISKIEVVND